MTVRRQRRAHDRQDASGDGDDHRATPRAAAPRGRERTDARVLLGVWVAWNTLHELLGRRKPFLTAKRLLTNPPFHDIYRTNTLGVDQRLKITSLTFLFTEGL